MATYKHNRLSRFIKILGSVLLFSVATFFNAFGQEISIDDLTVIEGNTGTVTANFTVRLSPASAQTVTVDYATSDGTATAPDDYSAVTQTTLSFAPGTTTETISISINGDVLIEPDETFFVDLSNPVNATLAENQGQATIIDDENLRVLRGPYLQIGTPASMIVKWRTNQATNSVVRYGTDPGTLNQSTSDSGLKTEHELNITGLSPDSKYYYSIGTTSETLAGGDTTHFFITSPVPGTSKSTRIWILGDSGTKNDNARLVRDAYYNFSGDRHTDLWLMLGDNAYPDGTDAEYQLAIFENMYEEMLRKSVLWPTFGNHDEHTLSTPGPHPYFDIFTLPENGEAGGVASSSEAYYSFDYGNLHLICLNSTTDSLLSTSSAMWVWLQEDLAANDKDWTIAFWHHPPYSKGFHDSDLSSTLIKIRERALPLLEASGVDLILSGHSHSYERSFLLDGHYGLSNTLTNDMILDGGDGKNDGDGAYKKATLGASPHEGTVYIVAGSSGQITGGTLNHPVMITSLNVLGSVVLDVDDNKMDAKFIDNNGAIADYFTLMKGATVAEFVGTPSNGNSPLLVSFTDQSSGTPVSWFWDFGDGGTSTEQNPSHTYNTAGVYTVSLTVTGADGSDTETKTDYITVTEPGATVTVSFQDGVDGYSGTRDTKLLFDTPTSIYGSATPLEADGSPDKSFLLFWDLSSIPPGSL
ncbi:MAG: PKD domain-containing protein, partial [Planctomycetota bacterium]